MPELLTGQNIVIAGAVISAFYAALNYHRPPPMRVDAMARENYLSKPSNLPLQTIIFGLLSVGLLILSMTYLAPTPKVGPRGPQGLTGPPGAPGLAVQLTEFDRKFARKLFLEKELPTLQAEASEFGKKVGQFVDQSIRCSSNSSMAQAESCRIFTESTKFAEDDIIRFFRNDLNMVISPDDVCGRDMSDPYPEEDQMNISSPKKYEYRVRTARFHCAEQTISKILITMQKDIDSATSYINGIGRESYVAK
jgi:hypothetical protein